MAFWMMRARFQALFGDILRPAGPAKGLSALSPPVLAVDDAAQGGPPHACNRVTTGPPHLPSPLSSSQ